MSVRTASHVAPRRQGAFSLIEILTVILVMAVLFGIAIAIPTGEEREGEVRGAAEELAAVLRETRTRAIRHNRPYAVSFNIENAPGSSGKILNNRSGGHWYRVLGPNDTLQAGTKMPSDSRFNGLPLFDPTRSSLNGVSTQFNPPPLRHYLELVSRLWVDEPHTLKKGKVRFLALTDQDNGENSAPAQGGFYSATYPRPWFGWWESGTQELHTWGGYDPNLKPTRQLTTRNLINGRMCSASGFYYEGWEGEIVGCVNPADREVLDDSETSGSVGVFDAGDSGSRYTVLKKGEPRPLINGKWLDFIIVFQPDGSVSDDWFRMRQGYWSVQNPSQLRPIMGGPDPYVGTFPLHNTKDSGLADMCNALSLLRNWDDPTTSYLHRSQFQREATSYVNRTGYYWITLAADAKNDQSTFPSAEAALHSLNPIYRVGVSPDGQVKVIRVKNTYSGPLTFDATITGSDWENKNKIWGKTGANWIQTDPVTTPNYINHELHEADGTPRGLPVHDYVLPEMMRERKWWWNY
jgi:type II secretory pathway pseudopilin PulG